ncbi:peptidylprolyl isomerase [Arthrobacter sp. USHLN218]|uniref:peptidylprolyl isomerase n=1 Tax=Arthrobacter sp. USHLN218 TaxID=3081232 RepID=UPI003018C935
MAAKRENRDMRRRVAQMEAKRALRQDQLRRRKRDNIIGASAIAVAVVAGVLVQLTVFNSNPTPAEIEKVRSGIEESIPSGQASPQATNAAHIPSPDLAAGRVLSGTLSTNQGDITVELDGKAAPQAVSVFKSLADEGFFKGKNCHRLTTAPSMGVLQCGSADGKGGGDPEFQWGPVENSPADGSYPAGTIAVARGQSTFSNGTQFFIAYKDSTITQDTGGYTIMGKVSGGLDVVRRIAEGGVTETGSQDGTPKIAVTIDALTLD